MSSEPFTFFRLALPRPFYVTGSCVGVRFPSEVGGCTVSVVVPPGVVLHTGLLHAQMLASVALAGVWRAAVDMPADLERTMRAVDGSPVHGTGVFTRWLVLAAEDAGWLRYRAGSRCTQARTWRPPTRGRRRASTVR